ncbi:hypothetical protein [Staphylococcus shinii]|uniref:hypothetical protein n=1 Tax=Staphylococcus shinii TaxID=2912228 RepID=UPI003F559F85
MNNKIIISGTLMIAVTYGLARFAFGLLLPNISNDLKLGYLVLFIGIENCEESTRIQISFSKLRTNPYKGGLVLFIFTTL